MYLLGPNIGVNLPDVLLEKSDFPMNYIYTVAATSVVFFIINLFMLLWWIVRKRNKARKCQMDLQFRLDLLSSIVKITTSA